MKETKEKVAVATDRIVVNKVRVISKDKRYSRIPYPFTVAKSQSKDNFVTGQEDILSEDQMRGKEKLLPAQKRQMMMGINPYIIHPESIYMLSNLRTFDLSYKITGDEPEDREYLNARDYAEYTFFIAQESVCQGKENYQVNKHFFYMEDKEKESEVELQSIDLIWEAENFVRTKMALNRYGDIILLMNFEIPGFDMNPSKMTDIVLRSTVLKACKDHPQIVLKLSKEDAGQILFVLKLLYHKIIERRNNTDFYSGETFVGATLEAVKMFCAKSENTVLVTKWGRTIETKEEK